MFSFSPLTSVCLLFYAFFFVVVFLHPRQKTKNSFSARLFSPRNRKQSKKLFAANRLTQRAVVAPRRSSTRYHNCHNPWSLRPYVRTAPPKSTGVWHRVGVDGGLPPADVTSVPGPGPRAHGLLLGGESEAEQSIAKQDQKRTVQKWTEPLWG